MKFRHVWNSPILPRIRATMAFWRSSKTLARSSESQIKAIEELYAVNRNFCNRNSFIMNPNVYIALSSADLNEILADIAFSMGDWRRKLHCRHLAILLVSFIEDLPQLMGKEFRSRLQSEPELLPLLPKIDAIMKDINLFRKDHESDLRALRNVASAHRDHSAIDMLEAIKAVDTFELTKIATSIVDFQGRLLTVCTEILSQILKKLP